MGPTLSKFEIGICLRARDVFDPELFFPAAVGCILVSTHIIRNHISPFSGPLMDDILIVELSFTAMVDGSLTVTAVSRSLRVAFGLVMCPETGSPLSLTAEDMSALCQVVYILLATAEKMP